MNDWLYILLGYIKNSTPSVLVTIIETKGSTPREVSTRMVVSSSQSFGTVGGGNLEHQCIIIARQRLSAESEKGWISYEQQFQLGANLAQCCGGVVKVLFEFIDNGSRSWVDQLTSFKNNKTPSLIVSSTDHSSLDKFVFPLTGEQKYAEVDSLASYCQELAVQLFQDSDAKSIKKFNYKLNNKEFLIELVKPCEFTIMLFGAGHVGRALVNTMSGIDCNILWVDSRQDEFLQTIPNNTQTFIEEDPEDAVITAPAGTFFLIMTHNHQLDLRLCEEVLTRGDYAYCGLIGSKSKRLKFEKRLLAKSFSQTSISQLTCPIGLSGISSKNPFEIAIGVTAELLQIRSKQAAELTSNHSVRKTHYQEPALNKV